MFEQIITSIANVGFPCALCIYVVARIEPTLNALVQAVNELKAVVHTLHNEEL